LRFATESDRVFLVLIIFNDGKFTTSSSTISRSFGLQTLYLASRLDKIEFTFFRFKFLTLTSVNHLYELG
jgi:hypothetical protein